MSSNVSTFIESLKNLSRENNTSDHLIRFLWSNYTNVGVEWDQICNDLILSVPFLYSSLDNFTFKQFDISNLSFWIRSIDIGFEHIVSGLIGLVPDVSNLVLQFIFTLFEKPLQSKSKLINVHLESIYQSLIRLSITLLDFTDDSKKLKTYLFFRSNALEISQNSSTSIKKQANKHVKNNSRSKNSKLNQQEAVLIKRTSYAVQLILNKFPSIETYEFLISYRSVLINILKDSMESNFIKSLIVRKLLPHLSKISIAPLLDSSILLNPMIQTSSNNNNHSDSLLWSSKIEIKSFVYNFLNHILKSNNENDIYIILITLVQFFDILIIPEGDNIFAENSLWENLSKTSIILDSTFRKLFSYILKGIIHHISSWSDTKKVEYSPSCPIFTYNLTKPQNSTSTSYSDLWNRYLLFSDALEDNSPQIIEAMWPQFEFLLLKSSDDTSQSESPTIHISWLRNIITRGILSELRPLRRFYLQKILFFADLNSKIPIRNSALLLNSFDLIVLILNSSGNLFYAHETIEMKNELLMLKNLLLFVSLHCSSFTSSVSTLPPTETNNTVKCDILHCVKSDFVIKLLEFGFGDKISGQTLTSILAFFASSQRIILDNKIIQLLTQGCSMIYNKYSSNIYMLLLNLTLLVCYNNQFDPESSTLSTDLVNLLLSIPSFYSKQNLIKSQASKVISKMETHTTKNGQQFNFSHILQNMALSHISFNHKNTLSRSNISFITFEDTVELASKIVKLVSFSDKEYQLTITRSIILNIFDEKELSTSKDTLVLASSISFMSKYLAPLKSDCISTEEIHLINLNILKSLEIYVLNTIQEYFSLSSQMGDNFDWMKALNEIKISQSVLSSVSSLSQILGSNIDPVVITILQTVNTNLLSYFKNKSFDSPLAMILLAGIFYSDDLQEDHILFNFTNSADLLYYMSILASYSWPLKSLSSEFDGPSWKSLAADFDDLRYKSLRSISYNIKKNIINNQLSSSISSFKDILESIMDGLVNNIESCSNQNLIHLFGTIKNVIPCCLVNATDSSKINHWMNSSYSMIGQDKYFTSRGVHQWLGAFFSNSQIFSTSEMIPYFSEWCEKLLELCNSYVGIANWFVELLVIGIEGSKNIETCKYLIPYLCELSLFGPARSASINYPFNEDIVLAGYSGPLTDTPARITMQRFLTVNGSLFADLVIRHLLTEYNNLSFEINRYTKNTQACLLDYRRWTTITLLAPYISSDYIQNVTQILWDQLLLDQLASVRSLIGLALTIIFVRIQDWSTSAKQILDFSKSYILNAEILKNEDILFTWITLSGVLLQIPLFGNKNETEFLPFKDLWIQILQALFPLVSYKSMFIRGSAQEMLSLIIDKHLTFMQTILDPQLVGIINGFIQFFKISSNYNSTQHSLTIKHQEAAENGATNENLITDESLIGVPKYKRKELLFTEIILQILNLSLNNSSDNPKLKERQFLDYLMKVLLLQFPVESELPKHEIIDDATYVQIVDRIESKDKVEGRSVNWTKSEAEKVQNQLDSMLENSTEYTISTIRKQNNGDTHDLESTLLILLPEYQRKILPWQSDQLDELDPIDINIIEGGLSVDIKKKQRLESEKRQSLIVVASLVEKMPNLAGLTRTCEIFSCAKLVVSTMRIIEDKSFKDIAVSAEQWLPMEEVSPGPALITYLKEMKETEGYTLVGVEQTSQSISLTDFSFPKKTLLLLGEEKHGIPADLIPLLDFCVEIPQLGIIRSLNVHVSASIMIWDYTKQNLNYP